jgi:L-histidine Nalpha-methyltransferase
MMRRFNNREINNYSEGVEEIILHDAIEFRNDVIAGLLSTPKRLNSKYFYDQQGDELFQKIMNCSEYYLTKCETEIFTKQTKELAAAITGANEEPFDLIELGVGDGTKSRYLLEELLKGKTDFNYLPIDISGNVLSHLERNLSNLKGLNIRYLEGEYLDMLREASEISNNRKVVLFLGANIGNMDMDEAQHFCKKVRNLLQPGDTFMIGFDLKKNPRTILNAYNDVNGITRDFNFNLLERINTELGADFNVSQFVHYPMYDPQTGACKSYLVSKVKQIVRIGEICVSFQEGECIFMEISQKYSVHDVQLLASHSGFAIQHNFTDSKKWFVDSIWNAVSSNANYKSIL